MYGGMCLGFTTIYPQFFSMSLANGKRPHIQRNLKIFLQCFGSSMYIRMHHSLYYKASIAKYPQYFLGTFRCYNMQTMRCYESYGAGYSAIGPPTTTML